MTPSTGLTSRDDLPVTIHEKEVNAFVKKRECERKRKQRTHQVYWRNYYYDDYGDGYGDDSLFDAGDP